MAGSLDAELFQHAVAAAFTGVLDVYREADALLRELRGTLSGTWSPLVARLTPTPGQQGPDGRYLSGYIATVFAPVNTDGDATSADEGEDEDDEDDDDEESGKKKGPLLVAAGSTLLIARVALHGSRWGGDLPKLSIHHMSNCNVVEPVDIGTPIRVARPRWFGRVVRALDGWHGAGGPLDTTAKAFIDMKPKARRTKLTVVPGATRSYPLFEIDSKHLAQIADEIRATM